MFLLLFFVSLGRLFSATIDDIYVPPDCANHATPSDHLLIELSVETSNGEIIKPQYVKPGNLFHIHLDQSDHPINRALKGMCENGTRVVHFNSAVDVDLSPLPISKYAFPVPTQPFSVRIVLHHITSQVDYQIFNAYKMGNISEVVDMIEVHRGVNAVDEWGHTLLMLATQKNDLQTVAILLNTRMPKVDVNKAKSNGYTAIFYAIQQPSTSILKALLRRGANPNTALTQKDSEGSTPLHFACEQEKVRHAELLLEYGADVRRSNGQGLYPLQMVPRDTVRSTKLYFKKLFEEAIEKQEKEQEQIVIDRRERTDL